MESEQVGVTMTTKEKENLCQSIFLIIAVVFKRYGGYLLGEYETSLFIFIALIGFYVIHLAFVKLAKDYPQRDNWEENFNLVTLLGFGLAVFILQLINAANILLIAVVGIILILINVLIKSKRRAAKNNMNQKDE